MSLDVLPYSYLAASAIYTAPAAMATAVINEQSLVPVGIAVVCCIFIGTLIAKVARTLQRIDDRLERLDEEIHSVRTNCDQRHPQYRPDDPKRLP
jgi:uncharacterized membrane protein YccC